MSSFAEYDTYDGLGLAELVREKEIAPVELVEEAIHRIERLNPQLNAVIYKAYDLAREAAEGPIPAGPFQGVPFLLKDLLASCKGMPMSKGSRFHQGFVPDHDSEIVKRFKAAGVLILGKTNTPEYGIGPVTEPELFGPTHNPWDLGRTAGGREAWRTVAFVTSEHDVEVDAFNVPAGAQARFRVLATDGVHTGGYLSDPVTVPNHEPTVDIVSPESGTTFLAGQTANLEGIAYDADTGSMPEDLLEWRSDVDGVLGSGHQLSTSEVSPGTHAVTFEADDGGGGKAAETVNITVVDDLAQLPSPPDALVAAPNPVRLDLGRGPAQRRLFVENRHSRASIAWEASASESWVEISSSSGTTPDSLVVGVSGNDVPAGAAATVTFTSPDAPGQGVTVQIRVTRRGMVFLPTVMRRD